MRYYKSNRRSYKSKRRYSRKSKRSVKPVKLHARTKATIEKLIGKHIESKQAYTSTGNTLIMFNSGIDSNADIRQVLPGIAQGSGDATRDGSQITAKSLNIKGYMKLGVNDVADNTAWPNVMVRLMCVSLKTHSNWTQVSSQGSSLGTLLRKGNTTVGFTGAISDLYAPINNEVFTVHYDRKFNLSQTFINAIGANVPSQYVPQDLSKTIRFFNINVRCKNKVLKYDPTYTDSLYPTNFAPFLILGYCNMDGAQIDTLTTKIGLQYDAVLNYEDA